jgi:hypothetical protein
MTGLEKGSGLSGPFLVSGYPVDKEDARDIAAFRCARVSLSAISNWREH